MTVSTHKAQLEIGADGSQAISEFGRVQAASGKMAEGVKKAGTEASGGLDSVAKGAEASANKMTRAERSMVSSIQRVTAQAQAAGKQSAVFENLIDLRGLDRAKFEPYLQGLRQAEVQTQSLGNTAKQTAASLRMVPAQLTDIVVSLQGGQAPMTVLLQQGGQLKDMFGGIGPAARALGGYVMGMVNPFTAAAAAGAALAVAAYQGAQESKAFTDTLITTGNQAGVTAGRLMLMAQSLDSVAGTQGNAAAVLNQLAATGQVTAAGLQLAAQAAIEFERAGGQAAEKTVQGFAELGKAPLAATIKLNESMGYLTRSTYEQIKSLEEQGRTADAAALAQKAFADALLTRAPEMLANMGYLETGWVNIKDAVKEAWDGIKNIGRDAGVEGQSAAVGAAIARLDGVIRTKTQGGYNTQMFDAELAKLKERQSILQSDERLLRSAADHQAQQTREVEARVKWDKDGAQYLGKKVKMEREITQAISEGTKAKATQADIDARVAAIREKYKEKAGPKDRFVPGADNAREWETYMKAFGAAAVDAEVKVSGLTKTQGKLIEYLGSGAYLNMPEPARQTALQAAYAAIATEQQVEATKHQAQAWKEANKAALAYGKQLDDMALAGADVIAQATNYAAAIDQQVAATEFEASLIGQSNVQRGIALKQYQIELDTKKEIARINATLASQADRDAAISAVKAAGDKAKASAAAEVVNQEFTRVSAQIEQSLTDALMRGFESGKGFAENLRDTVANMFKTMVLRPVIQATVQGGLNAIGMGGPAGSMGGNMLGNMASNYAGGAIGAGLWGSSAAYGAALGTTSIGAGSQAAMLAAQTGAFGSAGTAATAAAAGNAGMSAAMTAGPYVAAAIAVIALAKSLDDSGTMHTGGLGSYSAARGASTGDAVKSQGLGFDLSSNDYNASTAQASAGIAQAVAGMLDSTATTFGQKAGYYAATAFADDTSSDGAWGALMLKLGDQVLLDWKNGQDRWPGREFSDGESGAKEYAAAVAKDVRDYLITQTPAWADTMLTALGDAPSLEQLAATVGQINATATALEGMGRASAAFANLADNATNTLITALGGAESAVANLGGYYSNFYTEAERSATATRQLTEQLATLGVALPETRDAYRDLVDNSLKSGNQQLAADLIKLSGAYATVSQSADDLAASAQQAAERTAAAAQQAAERTASSFKTLMQSIESSIKSVAAAEAEIADLELQSRIDAANAANDAARAMGDAAQTLRDYVRGQTTTPQEQFADVLRRAMQGDATAMQALPSAATAANDAALASARTATEYAIARAKTLVSVTAAADLAQSLSGLVDVPTGESQMSAALRELAQAIATMNNDVTNAISFDLVNKLGEIDTSGDSAIQFAELKAAFGALASESTLAKVFGSIDANGDGQISLLESIAANTNEMAKLDQIKSEVNSLDWGGASTPASARELASKANAMGWTAEEISAALGRFSGQEVADFFTSYGLTVKRGGLPAIDSAAAKAPGGFSLGGGKGGGSTTQPSSSATYYGSLGIPIYEPEAVARLDSINSYVNQLDWSAGNKAESASLLAAAAGSYGVTQAEIAAATGYSLSDIRSLFSGAGIPAFALGGVFTNGIVTRPTAFDIGLMGEAGDEAIMPLSRMPNGQLGVAAYSGGRDSNAAVVAVLREVHTELQNLRAETRATAINTGRLEQLTKRVTRNGEAMQTQEVAA